MNNTYEWCSENVEPEIDYLHDLSSDMFPWWMKKLKNQETIVINDVENIPLIGINEKNILKEQSAVSIPETIEFLTKKPPTPLVFSGEQFLNFLKSWLI